MTDLFDWKRAMAEDLLNEKHLQAHLFPLTADYRSYQRIQTWVNNRF